MKEKYDFGKGKRGAVTIDSPCGRACLRLVGRVILTKEERLKMASRSKAEIKIRKMARKGFRGFPVATIAFYGPDDEKATKVAVGIVENDDEEPTFLERWYSETQDIRTASAIYRQILDFIRQHKVKSVAIVDRILGCPHEEGIDYPDGSTCPVCPFWKNRDRFTGEIIQ